VVQGVWENFLKIAKEEAGSRVVETWFKAVSLYQWDSIKKIVYLIAPNTFVKDWISSNYIFLLQKHLARLFNVDSLKIVLIDGSKRSKQLSSDLNGVDVAEVTCLVPAKLDRTKTSIVKNARPKSSCSINFNYQFENFVEGPSNSLAKAAAQAITEKPGTLYNPLLIYGDSGLGKTHLLHSVGNCIRQKDKRLSVLYQTADRFVNEFISAIRFDKIHKFQMKYQSVDVLLIDDIQFISNKEQTQEAFFHIFNALYDSHKQIVFSSDTYPQNIRGLADRLKSRLACGLVTDIHTPSLETKVAILKKKAELSNEHLPDDIAYFIASLVASNIRELEGALIRVTAFASLTSQPLSITLAKKVLQRTQKTKERDGIDFKRIIKYINKYYNFDLSQLKSKGRGKKLSFARQIAMFLMKKLTGRSLRDIGIFFARDHSTVIYAVDKIEQSITKDTRLAGQLKKIEKEITERL